MAENSPNRRKLIVSVAIIFLLVGLTGGGWWWYRSTKYVSTDDARISGTIVSISAKVPGRIAEVLVKEGDQVKAGQLIAKIDARDAAAQKAQVEAALAAARAKYDEAVNGSRPQQIGQAKAEVEQTQATIEQARANMNNAQKHYQRIYKLYQDGAVSVSQCDDAQAAYQVAREAYNASVQAASGASQRLDLAVVGSREEEIRAARAQVKQAEAAVEAASLGHEYTAIYSPAEGVVALKSVNTGEVVSAGQPLFSVVDCKDIWLNARIEETKIGKIRTGQLVDYTIDGYPGKTFTGTVYEIGAATNSVFSLIPTENSSGNFTKVTQRIPIKITLPDSTDDLVFRPGMQSVISIHLQ